MSKRDRRRLERFDRQCARAVARQRARVEVYRTAEVRGAQPTARSALAFSIAAAACGLAAPILGIVLEQKVLAIVVAVAFWVLLGLAISLWTDRGGGRLLHDRARAATAKQEALLRELEAAQATRRRALVAALGLEESAI